MKKKDFLIELRSQNADELKRRVEEFKGKLINLRVKSKQGMLKNALEIRGMRHGIGIINTILREKENKGG